MVNSNKNIDNKIFIRYLEGNGASEDKYIVRQWFSDTGLEKELIEKSLQFWDGILPDPDIKGYNGSQILDHIHHKIKIDEAVFLNRTRYKIRFIDYLTRIAAILLIPVLVASLLFYFQNNSFRNNISYAEIHSPYGTRSAFYLPDGSTGWLNGGASLKFPTQFGNKTREVELTGEAYFNVTSDHKNPFIVSTGNIYVKAYGTSFNVMAYTDEQITEVTLERGKVEVYKRINDQAISIGILKPNESCIYNSLSDSSKILSVNSTEKLSWVDGKMIFRYEPFKEVVQKINRWYNVNIIIKDEVLESYVYFGTFKDETLDEVLKLLSFTAPIRYRDIEMRQRQDGTFELRRIEIFYKR